MTEDIAFLGATPIERLKNLMATLRDPKNGCPWDTEQTFETIAPYTIEEAYEVSDAIARSNMDDLREELGDLLFQVVFHARMAEELSEFDLNTVCDDLTRKMVRRHPHVFETGDNRTASEQTLAWEEMKAAERKTKAKNQEASLLDGIAHALPALMRAEKLQKRAARAGFDWPDISGVTDKISEEAKEVAEAAENKDPDSLEDEIGDLLFAVTNLGRHLGVDPEKALRRTNAKFTRRFTYIEEAARNRNRSLSDMSLEDMETHWIAAKMDENAVKP